MKKKVFILIVIAAGILLTVGGGCGYAGMKTARGIINGDLKFSDLSFRTLKWCTNGLPLTDKLENILDGKYIVLLQNNTELRATGGFMGSYVRINFQKGRLANYSVSDIYQPDGQLVGHVEPPYPVQEAFGTGYWKLRDSNWDPDFPIAASTVKWFLEQGGEGDIKGMAAVNLDFLKQWLWALGGIKVITYDQTVTDKNLYSLAQSQAEIGWKPGSTQKRDFLGAVGAALVEKTKAAKITELIKLTKLTTEELNKKQILMWTEDKATEADIQRLGWDGGLITNWDGSGDYLYIVDSNTGSNKADCCIKRSVKQDLESQRKGYAGKLEIIWQNENEFSAAKPPVFWGGDYYDYVRVILPKESFTIKGISVDGKQLRQATPLDFAIPNSQRQGRSMEMYATDSKPGITNNLDLQTTGFWVYVKAGEKATAEITYESGRNPTGKFKQKIKRQPGVESFDYQLMIDGKIQAEKKIDRDELIDLSRI